MDIYNPSLTIPLEIIYQKVNFWAKCKSKRKKKDLSKTTFPFLRMLRLGQETRFRQTRRKIPNRSQEKFHSLTKKVLKKFCPEKYFNFKVLSWTCIRQL